jgi:hypothetical protein
MKFKALLTIVAFLALQVSIHSQINYEGSFDEKTHSILLDNGELKHASYDKAENAIILYHSDNSQWKSVPLNLPRNLYFDELKSISVNVFKEDGLIELAYTCVEYHISNELEATTNYVDVHSTLFVINEEGALILEANNGSDMKIVDTNGEMKLWIYKKAGQGGKNTEHIDVYSLPNNYHSTKTKSHDGVYGIIGYRGGI